MIAFEMTTAQAWWAVCLIVVLGVAIPSTLALIGVRGHGWTGTFNAGLHTWDCRLCGRIEKPGCAASNCPNNVNRWSPRDWEMFEENNEIEKCNSAHRAVLAQQKVLDDERARLKKAARLQPGESMDDLEWRLSREYWDAVDVSRVELLTPYHRVASERFPRHARRMALG